MRRISRRWMSGAGAVAAKALGFALVVTALAVPAWATAGTPEMDPGLATSAIALIIGGMLLIGGRKRSK